MGVEFRLGGQDHNKVEDFLAQRPSGVHAIILDTKAAKHQQAAAEAAADAGIEVLFEPATERLTEPGFELPGLAYYRPELYDIDALSRDQGERTRLVDAVWAAHPSFVTVRTPPHFFVRDERAAHLNVALAEDARARYEGKLRPTLVLSSRYPIAAAGELAAEYIASGITELELRISPLGGENESVRKVRAAFALLDAFTSAGLTVTLGQSGNIGQVALALGHAGHFSIGIGMREKVDHVAAITRQKAPPKQSEDGETQSGGPTAGIYLPGLALTSNPRVGRVFLANTDIRTRVGCRLGICGTSVHGPGLDPRAHYLHARTHEVQQLISRPQRWRHSSEIDRLRRALELRELINRSYLADGSKAIPTRTLGSLINDIESERAHRTA